MKHTGTLLIILLAFSSLFSQEKSLELKAQLFSKNIISTGMYERDAALSPDGKEFYFTISLNRTVTYIACSHFKNGKWTKPEIAEFSGKYHDLEPVFHPDGQRLFFVSNRPVNKNTDKTKDFDIWYVERKDNSWGEPKNLGAPVNSPANEFYPSFTHDGTIYFCAKYKNSKNGEDIYYCPYQNGKYQTPVNIGDSINTPSAEYNAFIAPDGSYIMYNTHGKGKGYGSGDIYISFKNKDGEWMQPVNMGNKINTPQFEFCPSLSPDGKYLFFTSQKTKPGITEKCNSYDKFIKFHNQPQNGNADIYRISTKIIENLKKKVDKTKTTSSINTNLFVL
jgi:Tol biopolymer transport system component